MSESEKQVIVETGANMDERQETADFARDETAGPLRQAQGRLSPRPDCSGERAGLGRDDSNGEDKSCVHSSSAGSDNGTSAVAPSLPAVGDESDHQDDPVALETGNSKLETAPVLETPNLKLETAAKLPGLCHHAMESGLYCQSPAVHERSYCYSHLRLRGRRIHMARAIAQRQAWKVALPPLDSMEAVLAGLDEVGSALAAGLLPPRQADLLLYTLRQAGAALRWMERRQATSIRPLTASAPSFSPAVGERAGDGDQQKRLVEEYPGFEAEFGLPAGLDLSQPGHVLFPPAAQVWPSATGAATTAQPLVYSDPPPSKPLWTKESIELEELDKRREHMSEKSFNQQSCKIHGRIEKMVKTEFRKEQEAEWQAEADRRNALQEEKNRIYRAMNDGERRAFQLGIAEGIECAKRDAEEETRNKKPPKTAVNTSQIVGMGRVDSR